jgi:hypothetical protein
MDFSMFDSGTFDLDSEAPAHAPTAPILLPSADLPRARWPTKDPL